MHIDNFKWITCPCSGRRQCSYVPAIARSTLAQWVGECGAQLQHLVQALADELRRHIVLHADETPVTMLKPGTARPVRLL